ncbi:hypothetical protein DPV78_006376 [Talaromyces pinophilus]|nr:hypothetical protein DPV78_006376 [Talaromyces pinophilus]
MERSQPFSSAPAPSEHLPGPVPGADIASSHDAATPNHIDSLPSTIPLDEASFLHPITIDDSEDDRPAPSSSRPRRVNGRRPDYTGHAFLHMIDDATTTSPRRCKRKRCGDADIDVADFASILDESYTKIERHYCLLSRKLKELEKKLDVSNQRNDELQAEITKLEWENYELKEQNDDLKKRKVLTCPVCLDPKEEWKDILVVLLLHFLDLASDGGFSSAWDFSVTIRRHVVRLQWMQALH